MNQRSTFESVTTILPTCYRINKGVKPWGGKKFHPTLDDPEKPTVTGHIHTLYRNYGPYSYHRDELTPIF